MRHLKAHRKLGRTSEHRTSMLRNLATSLINSREERIVTTLPKAKELRPFVERAITLSRRARNLTDDDAGALHLRRQAAGFFHAGNMTVASLTGKRGQLRPERTAGVAALRRLFNELGERYKDRPGGYTRILKLGHRDGDAAELAIIELVDNPRELEAAEAAKKRAKAASSKKKASKKAAKSEPAEDAEKHRAALCNLWLGQSMAARKEQSDMAAKPSVNMDELRELIALLRENGLAELELEREDFRVRLRREGASVSGDHTTPAPAPTAVPAPVSAPGPAPSAGSPLHPSVPATTAASEDQNLHAITSPIVGTFYRSPSPTAEPFVKIGTNVEPDSVVCIIEAMKLMNEIQAEASGEVVKIYVENGQPVEYGQALFGIRS